MHDRRHRSIGSPLPPISIAVFTQPDVKESLVDRVLDEAEAIWGPSGIRFDWHRMTSKDTPGGWRLTVTIDDERKGLEEWQAALGWIPFTADGPAPSIHLSRANAER